MTPKSISNHPFSTFNARKTIIFKKSCNFAPKNERI